MLRQEWQRARTYTVNPPTVLHSIKVVQCVPKGRKKPPRMDHTERASGPEGRRDRIVFRFKNVCAERFFPLFALHCVLSVDVCKLTWLYMHG